MNFEMNFSWTGKVLEFFFLVCNTLHEAFNNTCVFCRLAILIDVIDDIQSLLPYLRQTSVLKNEFFRTGRAQQTWAFCP